MDDRYKINQQTEELPFGTQFEATDQLISRSTQIHRFSIPGENAPSDWKEIYDNASSVLTTVSHMGLPIIYDRGVNDDGPYLIRQLVEEPTLVSRLEQGPLGEYEVWELAQQLLEIHVAGLGKGFFHGSLSLDRICYATRPGGEKRYYITDFGLGEVHNKINDTHEYFGLPCLICRKQAMGGQPSEVSEIFSIGQLLYLCLADNHPFASNQVDEMVELHQNYPLAPISDLRDDIPQPMVEWIAKMIELNPDDRFATYAEALENLPAPVQTVSIPEVLTATTQQQVQLAPVGQTTGVQQIGGQGVSLATASNPYKAKASGDSVKPLLQKPMVLGGMALLVLLVIVGIFALSDDDKGPATKSISEDSQSDDDSEDAQNISSSSESNGLSKGLIVALNFNGELAAKNNDAIEVEPLKSEASYEKGVFGKGLILDKNHYYRVPLDEKLFSGGSSNFTISFWVKNMDQQKPSFISDQPWESGQSYKMSSKGDQEKQFWQWSPKVSLEPTKSQSQKAKPQESWSMITLVFSRKTKKVSIYHNGALEGSSNTDSIKALGSEKYIYIGCDSRQKFNGVSPTVIDQFYVWNRKLSSKEIRLMHSERFSY